MLNRAKLCYYLTVAPVGYLGRQFWQRLRTRPGMACPGCRVQEVAAAAGAPEPRPSPLAGLRLVRPARLDDMLARYLADQYHRHRFDLLGSGWVDSAYHATAGGLAGHSHAMNLRLPPELGDGAWLQHVVHARDLPASKALWCLLRAIDPGYQPIDWQKDRKSGFRWSAREPHQRQARLSRGVAGADIIQPWELARLRHLPQLALIALHSPALRDAVTREIQCQVLDFAAANPVGMGVNWACTMDVGIRAANLVLTHWLLAADDLHREFAPGFEAVFTSVIRRHGLFISAHLEYNAGNTGNHYLANLAGLLFVTAFLTPDEQSAEWERLAILGLEREARRQFYPDGGHFEGSTCYHALCTELLVYAVALASRNDSGLALSESLRTTPSRAMGLLSQLRTPAGELPQFGDNDSGRLFTLVPRGSFITAAAARQCYADQADNGAPDSEPYFDENLLDYSGVTDTFCQGTLENQFLAALGGAALVAGHEPTTQVSPTEPVPARPAGRRLHFTASHSFYSKADLRAGLVLHRYPDSGIYIASSPALFLAISAHTNPKQKLNLSHNHNDKLALELYIDGAAVLTDPGTYVYTPLAQMRDRFRSVTAHNTIHVEGTEQCRFVDHFVSYPDARCSLLEFSTDAIELGLEYRGVKQRRRIEITRSAVTVTDHCNRPFRQCWNDFPWESPGYGKLRRRK